MTQKTENNIRCNMCDWQGEESRLVRGYEDSNLESAYDGCPNCGTDEYLMDIENSEVPQHSPLPYYLQIFGCMSKDIQLKTEGEVIARIYNGNATYKAKNTAYLIVNSVNAIGAMAEYLGCNPVELAERLQGGGLVELVEALEIASPLLVASYLDLERANDTGQDVVFAVSEVVKESLARLKGENNI